MKWGCQQMGMEQEVLMQDMPADLLSIVLTHLKVEHQFWQ